MSYIAPFTIYPAIDLRNGKVVRLVQGDPKQQIIYGNDPAETAARWIDAGASWLHVVNLDGAFGDGGSENLDALGEILKVAEKAAHPVSIQWGGGVRTMQDVKRLIELGIRRVIFGSAAVESPEIVMQALEKYGTEQIALAIDTREGKLNVRGWQQAVTVDPIDIGNKFSQLGLRTCIYTDIQRDGGGKGLNLAATLHFSRSTGLDVIASGGVASIEDVKQTAQAGLPGVIIGKALYEGKIDLASALVFQQRI